MRILMTADTVGGVWTYALELARAFADEAEIALATMGEPLSPIHRDEVRALPNVRIEEGVSVRGLLSADSTDGSGGAITGVQFDESSLSADLVVDAMGRGSSVADWLQV